MSSKLFKKIVVIFTLTTFIATNSIYAKPDSKSIFKNKKVDYQKLSDKTQEITQKKKAVLSGEDTDQAESREKEAQKILSSHLSDISLIHIPAELGKITEVYQNPDQKASSKLIVHIQDLHTNPEAETNLAKMLELLLDDYKMGLVCSEGAVGDLDTAKIASFPDYYAKEKMARVFVNSGELTGEEYLAITKRPDLPIWGIETEDIYFKNIVDFNKIMKFNVESQVFISQVKKAGEALKAKIYTKELLDLDRKEADYKAQKLEATAYIDYLTGYPKKLGISTANYKNITLLTETIKIEKTIDQLKVMNESQSLLLNLQSSIMAKSMRSDADSLMAKAQLFKDQKISPFSFYSYMRDFANKYLKDDFAAKYPNLNGFVDYLAKVNFLDSTSLFLELENLNFEIKEALSKTDEQKTFVKVLRNINFLEGFFNLKVSNEELDYYLNNKDSHRVAFFESFLKPALKKYNISAFIDYNPLLIDPHLAELEEFYKVVKERDLAMVDNSLSEIEKRNSRVSALIAGGFHTRGITKLLKERGYSYIVVSPYSKTDIDEENYHFLLSGQRKSITDLLNQLDLNEVVGRLAVTLRVPLACDESLTASFNEKVAPLIAELSGLPIEKVIIQPGTTRMALALSLQKRAELWARSEYDIEIKVQQPGVLVERYKGANGEYTYIKITKDGSSQAGKEDFTGNTVANGPLAGSIKVMPAAKDIGIDTTLPEQQYRNLEHYQALLGIFGGDETKLNEYMDRAKAARGLSGRRQVVMGMFNPEDRVEQIEEMIKLIQTRAPPEGKKVVLTFGGGTGLLASIKAVSGLENTFVRSIQTSIDDGGATFKMIRALIKAGFGWAPSPGDLMNSIFEGFGAQDKLYKLLDAQGRVDMVTQDKINKDEAAERKAVSKGETYKKKYPEKGKEGTERGIGSLVFYDDDGEIVYVKSFYELTKYLLARIAGQTVIKPTGIGYTEKTTNLSDDFVYFASSVLNIAKMMDEKFFSGTEPLIPEDGASIRNLMLLGAMSYLRLIDINNPPYKDKEDEKFTPLLKDEELAKRFQAALDMLGEMAGVQDQGRVSLSHNAPGTIYAEYEDNIIFIAGKDRDITNPKNLKALKVRKDGDNIEITVIETNERITITPQDTEAMPVRIDDMEIDFIMKDGNLSFKINGSEICMLEERGGKPENSVLYYDGKEYSIFNDGTGRVYDGTEVVKPGDKPKPLPFYMGNMSVYVRSRVVKNQTNITETPNYSKIKKLGFLNKDDVPGPGQKTVPNEDVLEAIRNPNTSCIIFGPGSFFTSIIPHLLVEGLPQALQERRKDTKNPIRIILALNPNVDNETANLTIPELLKFIEETTGYKIEDLFTDLVINKFDATKLEQLRTPELNGNKHMPASWYVDEILKNSGLVSELDLTYFGYLIDRFKSLTKDSEMPALSDLMDGRFALRYPIKNDNGEKLRILTGTDEEGKPVYKELDELNLREYLEAKIGELLETLYQEPTSEIRTDPGAASKEAKKSRGPLLYTESEISKIKAENPLLNIRSGLSIAGVVFAPSRDPKEKAAQKIAFLEGYFSSVLGDISGLPSRAGAAQDAGRGSVFGLLNTFARLGVKAGDEITVLGIQPERLKDAGKTWSESSVRREFTDAENLGIIKRIGKKDALGREMFIVLVSLTSDELQALPGSVKTMLDKGRIKGEEAEDMRRVINNAREKREAAVVALKLIAPLDAKGNAKMAVSFLRGGYKQEGYGVAEGAAIHGSFALTGNQGYYAQDSVGREIGKQAFLDTVNSMAEFFKKRAQRSGKPVKYVIKTGIGGQHTPFQGISDVFQVINAQTGKIAGEYELGKDFEAAMTGILRDLDADWDQVVLIPSSKSGSTDETMMVFVEIFYILLKHQAIKEGINGAKFADIVLKTLHEVNFIEGKERSGKDLFKVDADRFGGIDNLVTLIAERTKDIGMSREQVKGVFAKVLGNMFFETTDRVDQSRLSAFIHNSGLDSELGEDAPGFGAMFDNVGGRWTGDLHMMAFLAYHGLDAEKYWEIRKKGIVMVNKGTHTANALGDKIVDEGITDIALVVPDEFFWFGKSDEQNFNESLWQNGFANLVAIRQSQWDAQKSNYANNPKRLVINMSGMAIGGNAFNVFKLDAPDFGSLNNQGLANTFAELFTTFYGMTTVVGNRLIARALKEAGYTASDVDLNDLNNPATKIVQENLYTRQPFVELGKGLLESRLKSLQEREAVTPGAIEEEFESIKQLAREGKLDTNIEGLGVPANITNLDELKDAISKAYEFAKANGRKFVPFIYLEGGRFYDLRDYLISLGIEWVMQGTGDQHISYQQVLAQPQKYLPFVISFVPEKALPGRPAIGFAKGYLNNVSPHMVRDLFAEASYKALTDLRKEQGGLGLFLRMTDLETNIDMLKQAAKAAIADKSAGIPAKPKSLGAAAAGFTVEAATTGRSVVLAGVALPPEEHERLKNIARVDTVITDTKEQAEWQAARKIADLIKSKNENAEKIVIGFATGGTYQGIYAKLIKITEEENISWENVVTFNLDEYIWNSPGYNSAYRDQYYDIESYQAFMRNNLFTWLISNAGLKEENVHLMNGLTEDPEREVQSYEELIMSETNGEGVDLQVLGVGVEGHIAFIEARPDMPLDDFLGLKTKVEILAPSTRQANSRFFGNNVDATPPSAMTQGISTILKAKQILLVATGSGKVEAITKTIAGKVTPGVPASVLQVHKNTTIIVDKDAAQGLAGLAKASRRQQADSMDQIVAVDAARVIGDKKGFESWIAEQPENVAVVIIAMSDVEYENVRQYEDIAFIKVFGRDIKGDENRQALVTMFGELGTSELFGGFKLGTAGTIDQYKTAAGAIAEGV